MTMQIKFLGAAENVTGSCYLVETDRTRILVDCGMYQERDFKHRNWTPFPVEPQSIDAVVLTHAHLDHAGLLPKLVKEGFHGKIHCTPATADIAGIVLRDSARIQEEDAIYKKKRHQRERREAKHPEIALYGAQDAEDTIARFETTPYTDPVSINDDLDVSFHDAGHILGSAMVRIQAGHGADQRTLVFSGDVGRCGTPMLRDPTLFDQADYVCVESTYGDRLHKPESSVPEDLERVINDTCRAGGNIVIPSFAVERTQEILYRLNELLMADRIPHLLVFVDSPMAIRVTEVFRRHLDLFDDKTAELLKQGRHPCDFPGLTMSRTVAQSKAINRIKGTVIIIAGSGMCTGGRVKHHLANNIDRPESTILFVGYQASGTLGRTILEGAVDVRIHGQQHRVKARIDKINGFSAHADRDELIRWLGGLKTPPRHVFVTHGETKAAHAFAKRVADKTSWPVSVPVYEQQVALD